MAKLPSKLFSGHHIQHAWQLHTGLYTRNLGKRFDEYLRFGKRKDVNLGKCLLYQCPITLQFLDFIH